jgi:hypothetical protein
VKRNGLLINQIALFFTVGKSFGFMVCHHQAIVKHIQGIYAITLKILTKGIENSTLH